MRSPRSVNATHTVSPLAVICAYESLHLPVTVSRHERGGAAARDLMVCAKTSTSATESLQLEHLPMCSWISSRSVEGSSPVRRASMRVRTDLHRMGDSSFLQRIPQELQGAKDFAAQRGLGRADGLGDFSVGHVFHESKDDQLARLDGQGAHRTAEQLGILAALRVVAVMTDERTETAVVERLERLFQRARFRAAFVETKIARHAKQPRPQRQIDAALLVVLPRERAMCAQHRVLNDLLRVEGILQNAVRIAVERALVAIDQPLQRARFTTVDGDRQIFFGGLGAPHGLACPRVLHASLVTRAAHVSFAGAAPDGGCADGGRRLR